MTKRTAVYWVTTGNWFMIQCDNPIVMIPRLTPLFSKEWIELNCIEYFSSGNLPHRFPSHDWCICVLLLPNHWIETVHTCAGDPAGSGMSIMYVMALTFATELVEADKMRLQKHYEQNSNLDVRKKVIYTNWDTLDVLIGQNTRGSNAASDR